MTVWVEIDLCDGCKRCERTCPYDAVAVTEGKAGILDRCTSCGACLEVCRQGALQSDVKPRAIPDFSDCTGVWVYAEQRVGQLNPVSLELLGKARELADILEQTVVAVLLGDRIGHLVDLLMTHGADKVIVAQHPLLTTYRTRPYTAVLAELVQQHTPNILLLGASHIGRDLAPRLSRRIGCGLTADCTELTIDPETGILLQTRPAFGGNIMATITNRYSRPQMATVRPGVMIPRSRPGHTGQRVLHAVDEQSISDGIEVLQTVKEKQQPVDLTQAKVIVAGGRGVGSADGFAMLRELAELMGGEVAGTRVTVEEGWIAPQNQVGQTGKNVKPEIYIACGISGAIQHRAGILNARHIIAINTDPTAAIFQVADWGIVGDLYEVVPELMRQLGGGA